MSYQRISGFGETTTKPPPSVLVMPMIALFSVGLFAYLFREDLLGKKPRNARRPA